MVTSRARRHKFNLNFSSQRFLHGAASNLTMQQPNESTRVSLHAVSVGLNAATRREIFIAAKLSFNIQAEGLD
jgi:hypothetical protein